MAMKVTVDASRCVGHGMCALAAPEVFLLSDEDGHASVVFDVIPPELHDAVSQAKRGCPEDAIDIHDDHAGPVAASA